jgi:NAD-dependent SIR2 family protein deacetylase
VDKAINMIAPDPRTVVVFGAGFSGRNQSRGDKKGPVAVASIRAALASRRVVVMVDEYNTTACHLVCGTKMVEDEDDPHEKVCPKCTIKVDRDGNAAGNMHLVWTSQITTGQRPTHLRRP